MRFRFDERKTAEAAAHLVRRHEGRLNYMVLIKLLYLADRRSLVERGLPITGDRMVSMDHGPVLSRVLNLVHMGRRDSSPWFQYISEPVGYDVQLATTTFDPEDLSEYEIELLDEIDTRYGAMDKWDLVDVLHETLPEWTDPHGSSVPIDADDILRAEDVSEQEIRRVHEEAEELWFLGSLQVPASERG